MTDELENLGPGALGRLAVLTSEVRALRNEAARLATGAEQIAGELLQQRQVVSDVFELTVRTHDMIATLFQPEPASAKRNGHTEPPPAASSSERSPTQTDTAADPAAVAAAVLVGVAVASNELDKTDAPAASSGADVPSDGGSSGGGAARRPISRGMNSCRVLVPRILSI